MQYVADATILTDNFASVKMLFQVIRSGKISAQWNRFHKDWPVSEQGTEKYGNTKYNITKIDRIDNLYIHWKKKLCNIVL
jgi:hypothetical protein